MYVGVYIYLYDGKASFLQYAFSLTRVFEVIYFYILHFKKFYSWL